MHKITMDHLTENLCNEKTGDDLTDKEKSEALRNKPFLESYLVDLISDHELCKNIDPDCYVQDIKDIKELINTLIKGE